jgi:predicted transcriptional regulator
MKSIIISVRPEWAQKILNGEKTLELRKSVPKDIKEIIKEQGGIWVYMYVTKSGMVGHFDGYNYFAVSKKSHIKRHPTWNGKVVARWWFDDYYEINKIPTSNNYFLQKARQFPNIPYNYILDKLCLSNDDLWDYGNGKDLYAWHIKRLEIFDKPMELGEFYNTNLYLNFQEIKTYERMTNDLKSYKITRAPQSWQFVWVKE